MIPEYTKPAPGEEFNELRPARDVRRSRPRARNKRVWASVEKDAATVTREVFEEASARDPEGEIPDR